MAENNNNRKMAENNKTDDIIMLLKKLILNTKQNKQTPYDIKIKNRIQEPKLVEDMRFTPKQKYRKYKTKIEPNLLNKIMIDEEDDIVAKLKEEFENRNIYTTKQNAKSETEHPLKSTPLKLATSMYSDGEGISDTTKQDKEALTSSISPNITFKLSPAVAQRLRQRRETIFEDILTPSRPSLMSKAETPLQLELRRAKTSKVSEGIPSSPSLQFTDEQLQILSAFNKGLIEAARTGRGRGTARGRGRPKKQLEFEK